jgi:teichuronic acid biosynthesis glycosyltransferase TuaH
VTLAGVATEATRDRASEGLTVIVAGAPWSFPGFQGSERHLAEALARTGPVLYVDPPRPARHGVGEEGGPALGPRTSTVGAGITRLSLLIPGPERAGIRQAAEVIWRRAIRKAVRATGLPVTGAVVAIVVRQALDLFPEVPTVFWATDDFVAGSSLSGLAPGRLERGVQRVLDAGVVVAAASPQLVQRWEERGARSVLFPNAVDATLFGAAATAGPLPAPAGIAEPAAVFAGQLCSRVDPSLLLAVADRMGLLLIGPRRDTASDPAWDALLAHPQARWVGARAFAELPELFRSARVGLVPYTASAFNEASFPLKALEYLAAGLPVVSTPVPALGWLGSPEVDLVADPDHFASRSLQAAQRSVRDPDVRRRCSTLARAHDWSARAQTLRELFGREARRGRAAP